MSFETKETFEQQDTGAGTNRKRYCGDRCIKDVCKLATAATSRALAVWMSLMTFVDLSYLCDAFLLVSCTVLVGCQYDYMTILSACHCTTRKALSFSKGGLNRMLPCSFSLAIDSSGA